MKNRPIFKDVKSAVFWNDNHKLTLILEPLEITEPEPIIETPTNISVKTVVEVVIPLIPTDIKLEYENK